MGSRVLDFCEIWCDSVNMIYILVVAKGAVAGKLDCLAEEGGIWVRDPGVAKCESHYASS